MGAGKGDGVTTGHKLLVSWLKCLRPGEGWPGRRQAVQGSVKCPSMAVSLAVNQALLLTSSWKLPAGTGSIWKWL